MIKDFKTYIKEGRMGRLVHAGVDSVRKQDELTEEEVRSYIHPQYTNNCKKVIIRYEGNKHIVDIEGDYIFINDITEIPFQFGKVTGNFSCSNCRNLTSLEGCPKEVNLDFTCYKCPELTSLEGCPKKVGRNFQCDLCSNLTSLEGCPEKVSGWFSCSNCRNLTSLEGCPKEVGEDFYCDGCIRLFSLEDCPKKVGNDFYCNNIGKEFTFGDVRSLCNVEGRVIVE